MSNTKRSSRFSKRETVHKRNWNINPLTPDEDKRLQELKQEKKDIEKTIRIFDQIRLPIHQTISDILDLSKGEKFKTYVTFQELIDYKTDKQNEWDVKYSSLKDDNKKFKRFVSFIDELQYKLRFIYPFIDLEGVDLSWTTDKLVDYILDAYFSMPRITVTDVQKMREEAGRDSLADKIVEDMRKEK